LKQFVSAETKQRLSRSIGVDPPARFIADQDGIPRSAEQRAKVVAGREPRAGVQLTTAATTAILMTVEHYCLIISAIVGARRWEGQDLILVGVYTFSHIVPGGDPTMRSHLRFAYFGAGNRSS
jgi:hypothetical protein